MQCLLFFSYLHVTGDSYGRPISGQREVSAYSSLSDLNLWMAAEGIFIKPTEGLESRLSPERDEL